MTTLTMRWCRRRDMDAIVSTLAEDAAGQANWHDWLCEELRRHDQIGIVGELPNGAIVAFAMYALRLRSLEISVLGVHPDHRRRGYGAAVIEYLKGKIGTDMRRNQLVFFVPDEALDVQLLLRSQGIPCTGIDGDQYRFVIAASEIELGSEHRSNA